MTDVHTRILRVGLVVLLTGGAAYNAQAEELLVVHLLSDLDAFAGRRVEVAGQVTNIRTASTRKGQPQYTFQLSDGARSIVVLGSGAPPCRSGSDVVVVGTVQTRKQVNETVGLIQAVEVVCR